MEIYDFYDIIHKIGDGAFSNVFLATHRLSGIHVAIKIIKKDIFKEPNDIYFSISDVKREVETLKMINHPNIVKLFDYFEDDNNFYIVQELCENGTVAEYIKNNGNSEKPKIKLIFLQLINAVSYLHEVVGILHCDIKAENVLLDSNNNVKLIDFGFAHNQKNDEKKLSIYPKIKGTPAYIAPEVLQNHPNSIESDIWSIGIFLYYLITGSLPFDDYDIEGLIHSIIKMKPSFPSYLSSDATQLLIQILKKNPKYRYSLNQIKNSSWLKNISTGLDEIYRCISCDEKEIYSDIAQHIKSGSLNEIHDELMNDETNTCTIYYKILFRKKENEIYNDYLKSLKKKIEFRRSSTYSAEHPPNFFPKIRLLNTNPVGNNNCDSKKKKKVLISSKGSIPKLVDPIKFLE